MAEKVAADTASTSSSDAAANAAKKAAAASEQNPAFRMMGLPRLRLPSRNWMIFWTITGTFAGTVIYDKWQTKRNREKWCNVVSHIADEHLDTKTLPRRVTIYLEAPPGDGLRAAREHFHTYIKPVLVSAAMDWDVVEGRKEGDVRHKTAEKIRKLRRKNGEGKPMPPEEDDGTFTVEALRAKNGDHEYPGVAGDIVIGRHTWKEYIKGLHEGYLGPADAPEEPELDKTPDPSPAIHIPGSSSLGDAAVTSAANAVALHTDQAPVSSLDSIVGNESPANESSAPEIISEDKQAAEKNEDKEEEEKPKRRFPAPYILPEDYETAPLSPSAPEIIGPSVGVRLPNILGFRNTPIRLYRFLTRRNLMDDVGRQVAAAVLASHRPYATVPSIDDGSASESSTEIPEQQSVLDFEERDWFKTVKQPRKEHEEDIWLQPIAMDERITSRMRVFELTSDDEQRAKRIAAGTE